MKILSLALKRYQAVYAHIKTALNKIVAALKKKYPENILSVYAFGSRVRGDHKEGSDFDVLVLVNDRTVTLEEGIIDTFVEEEMKSGISFDPVIKTTHSFELEKKHHTPFYENVMRQGVQV